MEEARLWFDDQKKHAKCEIVAAAMDYYRAQQDGGDVPAILQRLSAMCREYEGVSVQWRAYAADRKAQKQAANQTKHALLLASQANEAQARRSARRGVTTTERKARWSGETGVDIRLQVRGGADLSELPETVREDRHTAAANNARRARETSTVHIDTGNVAYRLPKRERK